MEEKTNPPAPKSKGKVLELLGTKGSRERRWTYDKYWMIRKMIIQRICFEHIIQGQKTGILKYYNVKNEILTKINEFNEKVRSHPPVKNHFDEEYKMISDELNNAESILNDKKNEIKKKQKEIEKEKDAKTYIRLILELKPMKKEENILSSNLGQLWEKQSLLNEVKKEEEGKKNHLGKYILVEKRTMFDWVRFPPKGELNKVEKELIQSILEDGGKILGFNGSSFLRDLKGKYSQDYKVPNDSDIFKDLNIDDFLIREEVGVPAAVGSTNEEGETKSTPPPVWVSMGSENPVVSPDPDDPLKDWDMSNDKLGGRRKRRTRRKVRKKGTKKKARRTRRTRRRKRRRKRRTRKN